MGRVLETFCRKSVGAGRVIRDQAAEPDRRETAPMLAG